MAGFTMRCFRTGKSQGPTHFVAGHMPLQAPATGTMAVRTAFCLGMVSFKGSMAMDFTIFMTSSWSASDLHTNCALPSPWEPTPLPPVMCL